MDLSTTYMGLKLKNPLVPSASPLTAGIDSILRLAEAGAGAIVLHSLFEEQIRHEEEELVFYTEQGTEAYAEMTSIFPTPGDYRHEPDEYLELIHKAKLAAGIPIIASLNGSSLGGWTDYAHKFEQAGADALELNVYYVATDPKLSGEKVEQLYLDILKAVKKTVKIPVAMKLSPYFSSTANMAAKLDAAGASGLVLFNRFYQPDINLESLEVTPDLMLSTPFEMRLPLRWVAVLHGKLKASLAVTSGVASGRDVLKCIMAGAVLLRKGAGEIRTILRDLHLWMEQNEYTSIQQMKGSLSQKSCPDPAAFERANYMKTLNSYV